MAALLPANPGEALWIGGTAGKNHYNVGIGLGSSGGQNHEDFGQDLIAEGFVYSIAGGTSPYNDADKFYLNATGNPVFRINAGAGRTSTNTAHPRCELRELTASGASAKWDGRSGIHYMKGRCRVIDVTTNRPWVCFAQIHGSTSSPNTSDLIRIQTEGDTGTSTNLSIVARRTPPGGVEIRTVLATGYDVNDWISYELGMYDGRLKFYLNGVAVLDVTGMGQIDNYFKAGCYLQDNVEKGASASDFAAVEYERGSFVTWHTGYPNPTLPIFTGASDPEGGAGGGDGGPDTQAPTVPQDLVTLQDDQQITLIWSPSTDNVGVDHYNIYRFSDSGTGGGVGSTATVGKTTGGTSTTSSSTDKLAVSSAVADADGTLTTGYFRARMSEAGSTTSKMFVYADSSGAPGALLATSGQITIDDVAETIQEYPFTGGAQIAITSGTTYWIGAAWDDPGTPSVTYSRDGTSNKRLEQALTYPTAPNPFGTATGSFTGPIDAWLETVSAGTGGGTDTTLGKLTNGASNSVSSTDKVAVSSFTASGDGTLTTGAARVWMSAGSTLCRMVVVADTAGAPGNFLAVSDQVTLSATAEAEVAFTFSGSSQIHIANATTYWVGVAWDDPGADNFTISRDATASQRQETTTFTYPPTVGGAFGTPSAQSGPLDAYVNVTASAGFVLLTTTAAATYVDTGLTNGTEYTYVVSASDAAGNASAQSLPISDTPGPPDTTAPSVPTALVAVAGDRKVSLTWTASTDDDSGLDSYRIYQDATGGVQPDPEPSTMAWMVIDATTSGELATAAANGATHGLVQVYWDQCQSTLAGAVDATGVQDQIDDVLAAGLSVCLRVSLQYIPTFVDTAAVKFKNNSATEHDPGNVSGNNARDWVWSQATRDLVEDFLDKLFVQLTWSQIERVQLGGLVAGELSYPTTDGTVWWGYSTPAQTGTGIASGQVVCPVPAHVPSTGTTWVANDTAFVEWYLDSLNVWMLWLIDKHRDYFAGPIWVMHPGAGLRPVSQIPTDAGQALNYRANVAAGLDWARQIDAYPDDAVHPYSTWADSAHFWPPDPFNAVADGNAAPWYHLWRQADALGRADRIWGENTGGNTDADMDRVFVEGALSSPTNYEGLTWLSHDSLDSGTDDTYANWAARIAAITPAPGSGALAYYRGVNAAGGEFAAASATLPGTYSTDYAYDTATAFLNLAARGHEIIRLPFRWERVQPTRGAALDATELARLQQVVADIGAAGMLCVPDVHNGCEYIQTPGDGGATLVLGDTLPVADLVDLWGRLSDAFRGNPYIYAYGLMNEPHDLDAVAGTFSGTTRYDWASGVQGWTGDGASVSNVGGKLRFVLAPPSSSFYQTRKDDAGTDRNGPVTGNVLEATVTLAAGTPGTWEVLLQWQNASFAWQTATSTTYTRVDTSAVVSGLVANVAVQVRATFPTTIAAARPFAIQIQCNAPTAGSYTADVDNFAHGTVTGGLTAAQVWEEASQDLVDAIRANGDSTRIMVPGYHYSAAQDWPTNHPDPWIVDPSDNTTYEAHYYFDVDNSGDYPDSYATENAAAVSAGYASLVTRAQTELGRWTSWLSVNGVRGFLGETGWTNTADTASWNAVGEAVYDLCDEAGADVAYWAAGARWGGGYNLSAYTGTNQDTIKAQAAIIEAHPTVAGGVLVDDVLVAETETTSFVVNGLTNGTEYGFTVSAVDAAGNESAQSGAQLATPEPPPIAGVPWLLGELGAGAKLGVEIAWGAELGNDADSWTWTDITADVRNDPGISVSLGRNDESSTSNPASLTLALDNTTGAYSLGGHSANWPYVRRNAPVRVRVDPDDDAGGRVVFFGFADGFTPGWARHNIPVVTLSASGTLRRLAQGDAPVASSYRRVMTSTPSVLAYWPFEEGKDAEYAPAVRGAADMTIVAGTGFRGGPTGFGDPGWTSDDSFDCSAPLPTLKTGAFDAVVYPYADTGFQQVRFLFSVPEDGLPDGTTIIHIHTSGGVRWGLTYEINAIGESALGIFRMVDGVEHSNSIVGFDVNGRSGRLTLQLTTSGSDIDWSLDYLDANADRGGATSTIVGGGISDTLTGVTGGIVTLIEVNPHGHIGDMGFGHLTVENALNSLFTDSRALFAHRREYAVTAAKSNSRLGRLCIENGVPLDVYGTTAPDSNLRLSDKMGAQLVAPLLTLLHEAETADLGQLWDGHSAGLSYTNRRSREDGTIRLTIDASAGELTGGFDAVDDDQRTRNRVVVTRLFGVTSMAEDADGPLGTDTIGVYDTSYTVNCHAEAMALQHAQWQVHLGTVQGYRYPSVTLNLRKSPHLAPAVLGIVPGDRIDVTNLDDALDQFPGGTVSLIVEGISHELSATAWEVSFRCSPFSPWGVGRVAAEAGDTSDVLMRPDTDGSTLVGAPTPYRYYRFTCTALRSSPDMQLSEFAILDGGTRLTGMSISATGAASPAGEEPAKAGDNSTATKWFTSSGTAAVLTYDFGSAVAADGYRWATANDASERDPVSWVVAGSNDGSAWTTLDTQTSYATTTSRNTFLSDFSLTVPVGGVVAGATSIEVDTAVGAALWTTTADDYPLDLSVGGLYVHATACSGASSPQTFTVAALTHARAAGVEVKLWDPRPVGMG